MNGDYFDNQYNFLLDLGFRKNNAVYHYSKSSKVGRAVVIDQSAFDQAELKKLVEKLLAHRKTVAVCVVDLSKNDWQSPYKINLVITKVDGAFGVITDIIPGRSKMSLSFVGAKESEDKYLDKINSLELVQSGAVKLDKKQKAIYTTFYDYAENERIIMQLTQESLAFDEENLFGLLRAELFSLPLIPSERMLDYLAGYGRELTGCTFTNEVYLNVGGEAAVIAYHEQMIEVIEQFIGGYNG